MWVLYTELQDWQTFSPIGHNTLYFVAIKIRITTQIQPYI